MPVDRGQIIDYRLVFSVMAAASLASAILVAAIGRYEDPTRVTFISLLAAGGGLIALTIASWNKRGAWMPYVLAALCLVTAPLGWFFGTNSAFTAVIAVGLFLVGIMAQGGRAGRLLIAGVLAGGQLAVSVGVVFLGLPDESLVLMTYPKDPIVFGFVSHLMIQVGYLAAYLIGVRVRVRYRSLTGELESAIEETTRQRVLLSEAHAEYRAALAYGRQRIGEPVSVSQLARSSTEVPTINEPVGTDVTLDVTDKLEDSPVAAGLMVSGSSTNASPSHETRIPDEFDRSEVDDIDVVPLGAEHRRAREQAYQQKIRGVFIALVIACTAGAVFVQFAVENPMPRIAAQICFVLMILVALGIRLTLSTHIVYWPWALISLLTAGPAYAMGVNTGFAAFAALILFSGGLFQADRSPGWLNQRAWTVIMLCIGQATVSTLVITGVLPDDSTSAMFQPGAPLSEVVVLQSLVSVLYVVAFLAGTGVDVRHRELLEKMESAARQAAAQELLVADTREEIRRLLAANTTGLFSDHRLGDYEVGRLIGRGGMGEVYAATNTSGQAAALKVLRFDRVSDPTHLSNFLGEAEALARVDSVHVAHVLELGDFDTGMPFIAMEFIEGASLKSLLAEKARLATSDLGLLVEHIGAGIGDVHSAGILHRDIKPANIILTKGEHGPLWKLVDFGIATDAGPDAGAERMIIGTPRYMSPEQARGATLDRRSDLFSFSLVIYRAVTGRPAFVGARPRDIEREHRESGVPDPTAIAPMSRDLELALRIGLASDPDERYEDSDQLAVAIRAALAGQLSDELRARGEALLEREPWGLAPPVEGSEVATEEEGKRNITASEQVRTDASSSGHPRR